METPLISFDYAIKYLLKDKGDYEIVEGFISALFASEGYSPVKITALLNEESNKKSKDLKSSIADLVVEDEQGNNYIVEIDRAYTDLFLNKAVFNTSRLIVDQVGASQNYLQIKKVFHINLLYFPFRDSKSPLHHGKVIFHEIDHTHPVDVHLFDRRMRIYDAHNVFPEYFIVSIPLFDDVIKEEIHEWLYLMKYADIKEDFKSPYMQKVAKRLNMETMTPEERTVYNTYLMESLKKRDYIFSAEAKGIEIGMEQGIEHGIEKEKINTATNMLAANFDIAVIKKITGLSAEAIKTLRTDKEEKGEDRNKA